MGRALPSLWFLGAVAYAAATLVLAQIFYGGGGSAPHAAKETIKAEDEARIADIPVAEPPANTAPLQMPKLPPPPAKPADSEATLSSAAVQSRNELATVAGSPAVVRSQPGTSAPVLFGFPTGRPLRVLGRESGFAYVQDLRSSQLGWIEEAALASYREREVAGPPRQSRGLAENDLWDTPMIEKKQDEPRRAVKKRRGFAGILRRAFGRL
jgi:hypothetical protein